MDSQLAAFGFFPKLPTEIRLEIWGHALCEGTILPIEYTNRGHYQTATKSTSVIISQVNQEARGETKKYKVPLLGSLQHNTNPGSPILYRPWLTTNLERDVLCIRGNRANFLHLLRWLGTIPSQKPSLPHRRIAVSWTIIAWMILGTGFFDSDGEAEALILEFMRCCRQAQIKEILMIFASGPGNTSHHEVERAKSVLYPAFRPPRSFNVWRNTKSGISSERSLWPSMCAKIRLHAVNYESDRSRSYGLNDTWALDCEMIELMISAFFDAIRSKYLVAKEMTDDTEELLIPTFKLRRILSGSQDMELAKSGKIVDLEAIFND